MMKDLEIDTNAEHSPNSYEVAWVKISELKNSASILQHKYFSKSHESIYIFGRDAFSSMYGAQIFIEFHQFPEGQAQYEKLSTELYGKSAFKVNGNSLNPRILLPTMNTDYDVNSNLVKDGRHRRRVCHKIKCETYGLFLVYSLSGNMFHSCDFFENFSKKIWIK